MVMMSPVPRSHVRDVMAPVEVSVNCTLSGAWPDVGTAVNVAVIGVVVTLKAACGAGGLDGRGLTGRQADSAKPVMAISPTNSHRRAPVDRSCPFAPSVLTGEARGALAVRGAIGTTPGALECRDRDIAPLIMDRARPYDHDSMRRTIPELFRRAVDDAANRTWLLADERAYSYSDALEQVERAAGALRAAEVDRGDRILVTARNTPEYLLGWLALMEVGAVQVPVNPKSTRAELAGFVRQVTPRLVITDHDLAALVDEATGDVGVPVGSVDVGDLFAAAPDHRGPTRVDESDVAVMIPTSGTTGRSKLVMQTHLAYVMAGEGFPHWLRLTSEDRLMTSLPLFHINAPAYSTLGSVAARASLVLLPGFSASDFIAAARRYEATQFNAIGAMIEILMRQPARPDDADNPIRLCYTGPSPDRERQLEIEARFGFEIICGYALSETPYGLVWRHGSRPFGSLGSARQHPDLGHVNDARVVDDGRSVAPGGVGELELRNPAIMRGYYEMPDETAEVLVDGWLRTGDLVRDNGDETFTFVGRKKEVIRHRGENLSPAEVEAVLERHADVAEAAVVGVPSELTEQDVKAFVTAVPGRSLDLADVHALAGRNLARFKVPRYYEVVDELPHTPTGRLAKHVLSVERTPEEVDMVDTDPLEPGEAELLRTRIGSATPDRITVGGRDLPREVMGHLTLTELAFLLVTGREPTAGERRIVDAVLVSLADHGLTPSALAARLTYTGAPEAIQGAVAAGLLGAGSVFLGPAGDTAHFLADALASRGDDGTDDASLRRVAEIAVDAHRRTGQRVPGLGHPVHRAEDPRVPRLYELAAEENLLGPHLRLLAQVAEVHEERTGRQLPINGAGAGGAALADVGVPPGSVRGFVLIARTTGLVAHLAEEAEHPIGRSLVSEVERRVSDESD
jgi:carnitine-CoA ligase